MAATKNKPTFDLGGFEDVGIDVDVFWTGEVPFMCTPLEKREVTVDKKPAAYYVVKLVSEAPVASGKGDAREERQGKPGEMIGVWAKAKLNLDDLFGCQVYIERGEKVKMDGGKTMWKFTVKSRGQRGKAVPVINNRASDDDAPF